MDPTGRTVWSYDDLKYPYDADRLANGHTLVAENGGIREFDPTGREVRGRTEGLTWIVEVNRY